MDPDPAALPEDAGPGAGVGTGDGRHESLSERSDRNWNEILQEFRVTQTGTQIISGFLLTLAFQQRFTMLDGFQVTIYVILILLATTTTAIGLAPVALHRLFFRRHEKPRMVSIGNTLLIVDIVLVAVLTSGVAFFIVDVVLGFTAGILAGIAMFALLICLLVLLPIGAKK